MPDVKVDSMGVLKLRQNLKADKTAGPDTIKPIILKEPSFELYDVISAFLQKSLDTG